MSASYFDRPPLVGERVVIRRRTPSEPVDREGDEGIIIDVANRGLEFRIRFYDGDAKWFDLNNLAHPAPRPVPDAWADPQGYAEHVDAIEQRLAEQPLRWHMAPGATEIPARIMLMPTFDTERALVALTGAARVTRRVAFVPSVRL